MLAGNESPKPKLNNCDSGEVFMDDGAEQLMVDRHNTDSVPASKRYGKARIKSPLPRAKEGEGHHRRWILSFPPQSWFHRTNPVNNLEPSENYLGQIGIDETSPVTVPRPNRDVSDQQLDKCVDILEIFKANKEFFLKILQDPDACKNHFRGLRNSNISVRLTKSRSFPLANSSQARNIRPSTLKHKQNEVWLFLNREQSKFQKDHHVNSLTADPGDTSGSVNNHGWNQLVINRLSDIKQKIKHALKESKRERGQTPVEEEYQKTPFGDRTSIDRLEITIDQDSKKNDSSDDDLRRRRLQRVGRTVSLNESLERYAKLFENTSGKETKYSHSRSLRVTSEEKVAPHARKSCRRNLSLPDIDFLASLLNGTSRGSFRLEMPIKTLVDRSTNENGENQNTQPESSSIALVDVEKSELLDAVVETRLQNSIVERSETIANIYSDDLIVDENEKGIPGTDNTLEDANEPLKRENSSCQEEIYVTEDSGLELSQPNQGSVIETCFSDHVSEGLDETESSMLQQNRNTKALKHDRTEDRNRSLDNRSGHYFQPDITGNTDFNYVRDVLELSGFIDNEETSTWHSLDQPLSPSMFKELEDMLHHENEISENICNHQLLFDLVNETLVEMNEKSYTYFPKAFSLGRLVRPMPKGDHLLKEIWTRISSYLRLRPELDQSLDDVVARDLAKNDGWMDLEWEMEMVALELEDDIFDQLLDEVLCS
ncbi:protein TRM32 isoform X2 [Morus notabilis]|uniref:protein TRM32 isoform X2 n=1 Tax=Morus notabilis TaxID=981085 RepID=UPI000CED4E8A|nr:protein TRM32 isoform X2 [Morus notabilis]